MFLRNKCDILIVENFIVTNSYPKSEQLSMKRISDTKITDEHRSLERSVIDKLYYALIYKPVAEPDLDFVGDILRIKIYDLVITVAS